MITLQFISTQELAGLDEKEKIKKLLSYVKSNNDRNKFKVQGGRNSYDISREKDLARLAKVAL